MFNLTAGSTWRETPARRWENSRWTCLRSLTGRTQSSGDLQRRVECRKSSHFSDFDPGGRTCFQVDRKAGWTAPQMLSNCRLVLANQHAIHRTVAQVVASRPNDET